MTVQDLDGGDGLSFLVSVSRIPRDGEQPLRFEASAAALHRIAERFGLLGVERFAADLVASRWQKDGVSVRGMLEADVFQTDVVTLDPVRQRIREDVDLFFVPERSRSAGDAAVAGDREIDLDPGDDAPETFHGDRIEIAEPLVQILGLALDPYPRGENVEFEEIREGEREPSPFAALAKLRDRDRR